MKNFFNNALYIVLDGLSSDLLFWIVVQNLFLTTIKGLSSLQVILISFVGGGVGLLFYPLLMLIISKIKRYYCSISANFLILLSIVLYTVCNTIYGFFAAQFVYEIGFILKTVRKVMLKNNLKAQNNEDKFVKIRSMQTLLYAIITCIIASFAGNLFNVNPYIPMYCSISFCVLTLILSFFYKEPKEYESLEKRAQKLNFGFFKNKIFFVLAASIILIKGTIVFYHANSTLLLQTILQNGEIQLSKITLIISYIVLASRLFRIAGVYLTPFIYKKITNKSIIFCGALFLVSNVFYALGALINNSLITSIVLVSIGLMILISLRDFFTITCEQISFQIFDERQHGLLISTLQVLEIFGKLFVNAVAVLLMLRVSLNYVYLILMFFIIVGFALTFYLVKILKQNQVQENK